MLDLHTLKKTINWLIVRKLQEEKELRSITKGKKTFGIDIDQLDHISKIELLEDLIYELASKTEDIRCAIESTKSKL